MSCIACNVPLYRESYERCEKYVECGKCGKSTYSCIHKSCSINSLKECPSCTIDKSKMIITDKVIINYLLHKTELTKEEVIELIKEELISERTSGSFTKAAVKSLK